jgi:hypothetical protein
MSATISQCKPKSCARCGKTMMVKPCRWERTKYCSIECTKSRVAKTCIHCGKTFELPTSMAPKSNACSYRCAVANRTHKVRTTKEPTPVEGARWIQLPHGIFALVDAEDYEKVSKYSWWATSTRHRTYALTKIDKGRTSVSMHRIVLDYPEGEIDHINMNGLDNRKSNLRLATRQQQRFNECKAIVANATSKYKGVAKRRNGKWAAAIQNGNKVEHLGTFESEELAARAYDTKARQIQGSFGRYNFPLQGEQSALRE